VQYFCSILDRPINNALNLASDDESSEVLLVVNRRIENPPVAAFTTNRSPSSCRPDRSIEDEIAGGIVRRRKSSSNGFNSRFARYRTRLGANIRLACSGVISLSRGAYRLLLSARVQRAVKSWVGRSKYNSGISADKHRYERPSDHRSDHRSN